jgi:cell division protein ZapA
MTEGKKNAVKVSIGGDEYTLKSDRPPKYTRAVAEYVDRALSEVLSGATMVETHKAAILAALAITDELFQARRSQRETSRRLQSLAADLSRLLPPNRRNPNLTAPFA